MQKEFFASAWVQAENLEPSGMQEELEATKWALGKVQAEAQKLAGMIMDMRRSAAKTNEDRASDILHELNQYNGDEAGISLEPDEPNVLHEEKSALDMTFEPLPAEAPADNWEVFPVIMDEDLTGAPDLEIKQDEGRSEFELTLDNDTQPGVIGAGDLAFLEEVKEELDRKDEAEAMAGKPESSAPHAETVPEQPVLPSLETRLEDALEKNRRLVGIVEVLTKKDPEQVEVEEDVADYLLKQSHGLHWNPAPVTVSPTKLRTAQELAESILQKLRTGPPRPRQENNG